MTDSLPLCKDDGSAEDGDISKISGLDNDGNIGIHQDTWNGKSCNIAIETNNSNSQDLKNTLIDFIKNPTSDEKAIAGITVKISKKNISSLNTGPLIRIGDQTMGAASIDVSLEGKGLSDISKVVNVKNKRISGFPDFVMDWIARQTEELTTSLFTPPNLTIVLPTDFGQNAKVDKGFKSFLKDMKSAYSAESAQSLKNQMIDAYKNTDVSSQIQS